MSERPRRRAPVHGIVLVLVCAVGARAQTPPASPEPTEWIYSIRPGDTLWALGRELLARPHEWPLVQRLNQLPDADRLVPGMRLRIPFELMRIRPAPARAIEVSGNAVVVRADGRRAALAAEMPLYAGDAVETGGNGSASIGFADGSTVLLSANARMLEADGFEGAFGEPQSFDVPAPVVEPAPPRRPRARWLWLIPAAAIVAGVAVLF